MSKTPFEVEEKLSAVEKKIAALELPQNPSDLYDPIRYTMEGKGKRLRPLLTLLCYELFEEDWQKIINPSIAVEIFHNFTLVHDDIMDEAPLRRGQPTVYKKWNSNVAILSGDVMLVKAYDLLLEAPAGSVKILISAFNRAACEVCEGQMLDMNFEQRNDVSIEEYLEMIRLKTAVLLGYSCEAAAFLSEKDRFADALMTFGISMGLGFQLTDDLLDVFGNPEKVGKRKGGDIVANKKTYLLLKAYELASRSQKSELDKWLTNSKNPEDKVEAVTEIYRDLNIEKITRELISQYFEKARTEVVNIDGKEEAKKGLIAFMEYLIERQS